MATFSTHSFTPKNWYHDRRIKAVELFALWQGSVNTSDLISVFGTSRTAAQEDIWTYLKVAPGTIVYDKQARRYLATTALKPTLTSGSFAEWAVMMPKQCEQQSSHYNDLPMEKIRLVNQSIRDQRSIWVVVDGKQLETMPIELIYHANEILLSCDLPSNNTLPLDTVIID